ncbi:hypothetical protein [Deinococcus cellulosilyticus]|uniref:Uncharacterized protein n=1 Tax=Deinococcus cellulosilyticus (strain DSM 18568 / NBRC 106333 / KACC 11606 / 5516J-15) TaxID=1223518 RepID=A0A511N0Z5_DEIC1|nr:hypothetical protein [Deinococcus cellulosilyticus]GEM46534.1 hypothetical protein DC3_21690 [Deinococcus cellulosilyticus NBRC 106333 = KACC 11606]
MKWLKTLTYLFPASFRQRYARDLLRDTAEMHQEIQREAGPFKASLYLARASADLVQAALHEHWEETMLQLQHPRRLIPLGAALALTVLGMISYGQLNYQNHYPNPPVLSWMDPQIQTREVTHDPRYLALSDSIQRMYQPSQLRIWEVQVKRGAFGGTKRILFAQAVSAQLNPPERLPTVFKTTKEETQRGLETAINEFRQVGTFKEKIAPVLQSLRQHDFDARFFCVASEPRSVSMRYQTEPQHNGQRYIYRTASVEVSDRDFDGGSDLEDPENATLYWPPTTTVVAADQHWMPSVGGGSASAEGMEHILGQGPGIPTCSLGIQKWPARIKTDGNFVLTY